MAVLSDVKTMGDNIVRTHDGQVYFNFKEVAKIMGCGANTVPQKLHEAGILAKKIGPSKRVNAYEIAECMCFKRNVPYGKY